jgi:hypothetical protein
MNRSSFGRGKATFNCEVCDHKTRETWGVKVRDTLIAKITKRGGDVAKVKADMPDLFAVSAD